jgi:drug/metabolite transporter (DMT)-like permease
VNYGVGLLVLVTLVWGTTFPLVRAASADLNGLEITALRFVVASLCLLPFAWRASRGAWRDGATLGAIALVSYVAQAYGLGHISSNRSAFLTSTNILMVPLFSVAVGGRLKVQVVGAALLACLGIALMSWGDGGSPAGDCATLLGAVAYAIYVMLLSRRTQAHASVRLAATQVVTMAAVSVPLLLVMDLHGGSLSTLPPRLSPVLLSIVYLGAVASAGMLFFQAMGQRVVSASKAAVVYALEPVFAALFGWWWLRESMSTRALLGAGLVIVAVVVGEWRFATDDAA